MIKGYNSYLAFSNLLKSNCEISCKVCVVDWVEPTSSLSNLRKLVTLIDFPAKSSNCLVACLKLKCLNAFWASTPINWKYHRVINCEKSG